MFFIVLFLHLLIGHIFEVHVYSICLPKECLKCSITGATVAGPCDLCSLACVNVTVPVNCTREFRVKINRTESGVEEAASLTLPCDHDVPLSLNVTYEWRKNSEKIAGSEREYIIEKIFFDHEGAYVCVVHSECGSYTSAPHGVTVINNNVVILVICGCAALALVVLMGVCMKVKMHRDKVKNNQRTKERLQEMRRAQDLHNCVPRPNPNIVLQ